METLQNLFLPRFFYGDPFKAKAAWQALVLSGMEKPEHFRQQLASLEMVPYGEFPTKIILHSIDQPAFDDQNSFWRLNTVSEGFRDVNVDGITLNDWYLRFFNPVKMIFSEEVTKQRLRAACKRQRELILAGMEHLWFTLGFFHPSDCWALHKEVGFPLDEFLLQMLRPIIFWLPEIYEFLPKYYYYLGNLLFPYKDKKNPHCWWHIWSFLFMLLEVFDPRYPQWEMIDKISNNYGGDLPAALLEEGLIEPWGDRFRLKKNGGKFKKEKEGK